MVLPSHECWSDTPRGFCRCCHGYGTELMLALLLMLLTMLQLGVDGTAAVAVVLDVKLMSVSAELIVFVLIQVLMMSVWAQVHGQVLMCMPVCVIGTDDSGNKFMKIYSLVVQLLDSLEALRMAFARTPGWTLRSSTT